MPCTGISFWYPVHVILVVLSTLTDTDVFLYAFLNQEQILALSRFLLILNVNF